MLAEAAVVITTLATGLMAVSEDVLTENSVFGYVVAVAGLTMSGIDRVAAVLVAKVHPVPREMCMTCPTGAAVTFGVDVQPVIPERTVTAGSDGSWKPVGKVTSTWLPADRLPVPLEVNPIVQVAVADAAFDEPVKVTLETVAAEAGGRSARSPGLRRAGRARERSP